MSVTDSAPPSHYRDGASWQARHADGLVVRGRQFETAAVQAHFMSGNGFCGGVYWPFLQRLLPQLSLWTHDQLGQGDSDNPPNFSGADDWTARQCAVLDAAPPRRRIAIGHSFGAIMSLRLAKARPQAFEALVLLDPVAFPPALLAGIRLMHLTGTHPFARAARRRRNHWASRAEARAYLEGRGIYRGWRDEALEAFVEHAMTETVDGWRLRCPPVLEAEIYGRSAGGYRKALRQLKLPILFLYGADSYPFMPVAARHAARCGHATQVLPGGHCFMQENPEAAADAVGDFLAPILSS